MSFSLVFAQHVSNASTFIFRSSIPTHSRKLLKMNVLAFETCGAKTKASDISWSVFIQVQFGFMNVIL